MIRLVSQLRRWLGVAGLRDSPERALQGARELYWLAQDSGLDASEVDAMRRHFLRLPLQIKGGDLWRAIGNHLDPLPTTSASHEFLFQVAHLAPTWLARSPCAAAGKFELLYRLTRPGCGWPARGDVSDRGRVVEIKGERGRLTHPELTGACHHRIADAAFEARGFTPNVSHVRAMKGAASYEVIKSRTRAHYASQFALRPLEAALAIGEYLEECEVVGSGEGADAAAGVLNHGQAFDERLRRLWLTAIYKRLAREGPIDTMIVFGDGSNVKVVETEDDLDKLEITADGLRTGAPDRICFHIN
jgi:hypothetical protein